MEFLIRYISREYDVNEHVMLEIAWAESRYKPHAQNPYSSAGGVFQIIDGTWEAFGCKGDKYNPYQNIICAATIAKTSGFHHWNASRHVWSPRLALLDNTPEEA